MTALSPFRVGTGRAFLIHMNVFLQDVRFALRMLRKARGASLVAILSLALGISVNTTVFSWVRGILLNPIPGVSAGDRLATIETVSSSGELIDASYPDYRDFRDRSRLFDGVIAFKERPLGVAAGNDDTRTERLWALMVSGNYFDVLGVTPALGRFFAGVTSSATPSTRRRLPSSATRSGKAASTPTRASSGRPSGSTAAATR
jgi:hypothetical protein